jgi:spermidine synthase
MLGGTVYTFSMILAVFLTGLGLGSTGGAWVARRSENPRLVLGWCQLLQVIGIAWAAFMISVALPYWPINPSLAPSIWLNMHLDLTRTLWVVLPASLLWGASFPLALASVARPGEDSGRLVSGVYAANTLGAITGALAFSLVLIPKVGTQNAQQILVAISTASALLVFGILVWPTTAAAVGERLRLGTQRAGFLSALAAVALGVVVATRVPSIPPMLVAFGRYMVTWLGQVEVLYSGEGMNSSIAVTKLLNSGATQFHVAGKVQASSLPQDMRLQRMLGHLAALFHPNPKSAMVVGFGAGVTAGSLIVHPELQRLVICEIEPLVPATSSRFFAQENHNVFHDPRVEMVYDDARSYVLTGKEKFDIITSDPLDPWVKGAATLYTREHFERVKNHLNPGGIVTVFVQMYESNLGAVKSEIATFLDVFPNGSVWANNINGRGYDLVLLGTVDPLRIDVKQIEDRLARVDYQPVVASMSEVGFPTLIDLVSTFSARATDLTGWMSDAVINRDRSLRLQYIAGEGLNVYESAAIYESMTGPRTFPEEMFIADDAWKQQLRNALVGWR